MTFDEFLGGIQGCLCTVTYSETLDTKTQMSVLFEKRECVNKKTIQTVHVCQGHEAASPS